MQRIIVVGSPGSGKSYFSRKLGEITGIKVYHLDMIYHNPDRTTNSREYLIERQKEIFQKDEWIIDGAYLATLPLRLQQCDTVFYLDLDLETCLEGVRGRIGKQRDDMPWTEEEADPEFIEYVINFQVDQKPRMEKLLEEYSDKNIIIFRTREEINGYLEKVNNERQRT